MGSRPGLGLKMGFGPEWARRRAVVLGLGFGPEGSGREQEVGLGFGIEERGVGLVFGMEERMWEPAVELGLGFVKVEWVRRPAMELGLGFALGVELVLGFGTGEPVPEREREVGMEFGAERGMAGRGHRRRR